MSVQLQALADEVFDAAAAQARMGGESVRIPQGDAIWHPRYPDLSFLNGIVRLVAPEWSVEDFEQTIRETMPGVRAFRAYSRHPETISRLGNALTRAGYAHEVRIGMVHAFPPSRSLHNAADAIALVSDQRSWAAFEGSIRTDAREHFWTPAMIDQLIDLCHWSAENTPVRYYLAYESDKPAAHTGLFQHGATAYLHALYTHPDRRRRGVGSALTVAMREEAQSLGCDRLTLQCADDGYLPRYYAQLGFRPVGEQHLWTKQP